MTIFCRARTIRATLSHEWCGSNGGYALGNLRAPLGMAEYDLLKDRPKRLATNLPTIEQIDRELEGR